MALTVHPHQRGDNGFGATEEAAIIAVHPHQRGDNEPEPEPTPDKERFTPTSVGTTGMKSSMDILVPWFTPTSVGTTAVDAWVKTAIRGSPPPAWGQRALTSLKPDMPSVHPHQRGDNAPALLSCPWDSGPPPPAWGQRGSSDHLTQPSPGSPPPAWGQRSCC